MLVSCMGLTMEERGMYFTLMILYWEGECMLPARETLIKKLGIRGRRAEGILDNVLEEFFPDGIHEHLDLCRETALQTRRQNAANAQKGHEKRKNSGEISENSQGCDDMPPDF